VRRERFPVWIIPLVVVLFPGGSYAQSGGGDVYWHIDPSITTCSMIIDPSLTQGQWRTFTRQASDIISFKSLASASPLGKRNITVSVDYSITPVDQRDPAWINTFAHPDESCPLGDRIEFPTLRARAGISNRWDLGAFWTTAPGANYGFMGGEAKYAFQEEAGRMPAAAVSAAVTVLTGVPDFDLTVYSVGLTTSKRVRAFTPFLGVRGNLAVGTETTSKVDLERERLLLPQGFIGAEYSVWQLTLAAEYDIADVNTFALVIGFRP